MRPVGDVVDDVVAQDLPAVGELLLQLARRRSVDVVGRFRRKVLVDEQAAGPDRALDIERPKPLPVNAIALPSDLPADLLGRRPDVVAARWAVEASAQDIKSAKAAFLPNISITALAGLIAGPGKNIFQASASLYSVAPAISLPIFEGGKLRANLFGKETGGASAAVDSLTGDILICRSLCLDKTDSVDFQRILENFLDAAEKLMEKVKSAGAAAETAPLITFDPLSHSLLRA